MNPFHEPGSDTAIENNRKHLFAVHDLQNRGTIHVEALSHMSCKADLFSVFYSTVFVGYRILRGKRKGLTILRKQLTLRDNLILRPQNSRNSSTGCGIIN